MVSTMLLSLTLNASILLKSEKIYAVLAVLLVIFIGIAAYLFLLNKKVNLLEKKIEEVEKT